MPYQIAGIDVHKKMLAVVVADVEVEGDYHFERLKVGTSPAQLCAFADCLVEREVDEVIDLEVGNAGYVLRVVLHKDRVVAQKSGTGGGTGGCRGEDRG